MFSIIIFQFKKSSKLCRFQFQLRHSSREFRILCNSPEKCLILEKKREKYIFQQNFEQAAFFIFFFSLTSAGAKRTMLIFASRILIKSFNKAIESTKHNNVALAQKFCFDYLDRLTMMYLKSFKYKVRCCIPMT